MSANQTITANDIVQYLGNILNIDVSGKLTVLDMIEDLKSVEDLALFRIFVKERFNYERFRFLTGYQKFLALVNEFKKENGPRLDEVTQDKASSFALRLYLKTIGVFDEVNFMIQEGNSIRGEKITNLIGKAFMNEPKEVKALELVGKREELLRLCNNNKPLLEEKIYNAVNKLALEKAYPRLALENRKNFEGAATIEKLKLGIKS